METWRRKACLIIKNIQISYDIFWGTCSNLISRRQVWISYLLPLRDEWCGRQWSSQISKSHLAEHGMNLSWNEFRTLQGWSPVANVITCLSWVWKIGRELLIKTSLINVKISILGQKLVRLDITCYKSTVVVLWFCIPIRNTRIARNGSTCLLTCMHKMVLALTYWHRRRSLCFHFEVFTIRMTVRGAGT